MDVNGTHLHLLLGARDWLERLEESTLPPEEGLAWDPRGGRLTLRRELFRFPARGAEVPLTPEDRRGAGRDFFGHAYWIDSERAAVLYRPAGSRQTGRFWAVSDLADRLHDPRPDGDDFKNVATPPLPALPTLSGLAVTERHFLVVGTLEPGGLLVFDLHGSGPPMWWLWPEETPFEPFDLAPAVGGGLWVLDRPAGGEDRLWRLDRDLRVVRTGIDTVTEEAGEADFRPVGEGFPALMGRTFPSGISLDLASPLEAFDPVAVVGLADGVLLLEPDPPSGDTRVHHLPGGELSGVSISLRQALIDLLETDEDIVGHDFAFLPDADPAPGEVTGTLFVVSAEGNQSFAFRLFSDISGVFELIALDAYLPMRRYAGKALIEGTCDVYYDLADGWLALTEVPRPRYARRGQLDGLIFDGKEPACVWHRLFLDACIPTGDTLTVESRAADEPELLQQSPWRREPRPGLRPGGSEIPWTDGFGGDTHAEGSGTWELLFQNAVGRYLELRLTFSASGRSTPRLEALRVHYPRFSYLARYLPAVYREDPASASFMDRFLANIEGFYTEIEGRISAVETLFDTRTVPADALEWLASWLGAVLGPDWDEDRRRLFMAHAFELYRRRGTPRGLVQAIRLAVDECPDESLFAEEEASDTSAFFVRLVEQFGARSLPGPVLGDPTVPLAGPALVAAADPWQPAHGRARLDQLWREFLGDRYGEDAAGSSALSEAWGRDVASRLALYFPPLTPEAAVEASDRQSFLDSLDLSYDEVGIDDTPAWRQYLCKSYSRLAALNDAWHLAGNTAHASFDAIDLPTVRLPADGAPLNDWIRFTTSALPISRAAHRFTVLVPVGPERPPAERQRLVERVTEVVEREKPTHTAFDVRLYWALFRVGEARVGLDTFLGEGSRFTALTLGTGYLGESLLAEDHPWNIHDRRVVNRDLVGGPPPLT